MIEAGQAIKTHGSTPTCPAATAAGGGTILFTAPACRAVGENNATAIKAAATIVTRRIACPRYRSGLLGQFAITTEYRRVPGARYANSATVNNNSYETRFATAHPEPVAARLTRMIEKLKIFVLRFGAAEAIPPAIASTGRAPCGAQPPI